MRRFRDYLMIGITMAWIYIGDAWAQSQGDNPQAVVEDYSTQMIEILKGPQPYERARQFIAQLARAIRCS